MDQLDRVPYSYAPRTVTSHGESLVLRSKVRVLPEVWRLELIESQRHQVSRCCARCSSRQMLERNPARMIAKFSAAPLKPIDGRYGFRAPRSAP